MDNPNTFTTTKLSQTITFDYLPNPTYGDAPFKIHARSSSGLPVTFNSSDPTVATVTDSTVTILKAGTTDITAMQKGNATYDSADNYIQTFYVDKATLTVTADNKTRKIGVANPVFTFSYLGFVKGENASVIKTPPVASCDATPSSQAGDYYIDLSGGDADNYDFSFISGILTITSSDCGLQAIITNDIPILCPGDSLTLNADWQDNVTYQWYHNGSMVKAGADNYFTLYSDGKYSLTVVSATCIAYSSPLDIVYKTTGLLPVVVVKSGAIAHCASGKVLLGTSVAYSSYSWNTGDYTDTIGVTQSGQYSVTVPDTSGCYLTSVPYEINASEAATPSLCVVTVSPTTSHNIIVWKQDSGKIERYNIYKETTKANKYAVFDSAASNAMNFIVDATSNADVRSTATAFRLSTAAEWNLP